MAVKASPAIERRGLFGSGTHLPSYFAYRLSSDEPPFFSGGETWLSRCLEGLGLAACACFGVYYAFFATLAILFTGLLQAFQRSSRRHLFSSLAGCGILALTVGANLLPNLGYWRLHGRDAEVAQRQPVETEVYGLKLSQMLLPGARHRSGSLSRHRRPSWLGCLWPTRI